MLTPRPVRYCPTHALKALCNSSLRLSSRASATARNGPKPFVYASQAAVGEANRETATPSSNPSRKWLPNVVVIQLGVPPAKGEGCGAGGTIAYGCIT